MCNNGLSDLFPMSLSYDGTGRPSEVLQNGVYKFTAGKGFQSQAVLEIAKRVGRVVQMVEPVRAGDVVVVERAFSVDGEHTGASAAPLRSSVTRQGEVVKGAQLNAA